MVLVFFFYFSYINDFNRQNFCEPREIAARICQFGIVANPSCSEMCIRGFVGSCKIMLAVIPACRGVYRE